MKRKSLGQRALNRVGIATAAQIEQQMEEIRADADQRVKEAYASGWDDGNDDPAQGQIAAGGQGYRIASGGVREPSISWEKNLDSAWQLKQSNPLVDRSGEIHRDYIVGQGIEPKCADPDLQTILDGFWKDQAMPTFISELTRQWGDYGAQCVPTYVRQSDGRVRLGYIDPSLIERVIAHPENARQMWAVVKKAEQNQDAWIPSIGIEVYKIVRKAERIVVEEQVFHQLDAQHAEGCEWNANVAWLESQEYEAVHTDYYDDEIASISPLRDGHCPECGCEVATRFTSRTIEARWRNPNNGEDAELEDVSGKLATAEQSPRAPWEDVMLKSFGLDDYSGDCFLIRKNADSNQPLGRSDHLQVADFCDQHDGAMWSLSVREQLANVMIGLLRIAGDEEEVAKWEKKVNKWEKDTGTLLVVNESVLDLNLNSPVLNQTSSVSTTDAQRKLILGGEGIPDAWYSDPGGAHLATAQAQGDPTWRTLKHDQGLVQAWFVEMLEFVRDQAMIAGHYRPEPTEDEEGEEIPADTTVTLPMPEMTVRDVGALATALVSVIGAMSMAVGEGFASRDDGIDAVAKVLAELDVHPNVDELKDAAANDGQATLLGGGDTALNLQSWMATHAAMGESDD